jgi:hypothetical protein
MSCLFWLRRNRTPALRADAAIVLRPMAALMLGLLA